MSHPRVAVLNSGGLRSLVATALTLQDPDEPRVSLLPVFDGRSYGAVRTEYARRQVEHF